MDFHVPNKQENEL